MEHSMQWRAYKRCKYISQYFKSTVKNTESFIHSYKHKVNIIGFEIPMHIHNYRMKWAWWRIFMQQQRKNGWILHTHTISIESHHLFECLTSHRLQNVRKCVCILKKISHFSVVNCIKVFFVCVCIGWGALSLMVWNWNLVAFGLAEIVGK